MNATRIALEVDRSPEDALRCLAGDRMPFALVGRWAGGGAILGSEPVRVVTGPAALDVLDMEPCDAPERFVGGGWVGHLGFGLAAALERLPPPPPRPAPLPTARLAFYDHVLRLDADGRWWFEALREDAVERRFAELLRRMNGPAERRPWRLGPLRPHGAGSTGHLAAVADCVDRIAAGELFQANLCLRLEGRFDGSALDAFCDAAGRLRPAYAAFLADGHEAVLSFSPELFLRRRGREVETAPIKGSAPRAEDDAQAAATRDALVASPKDAAEHVMIVDLMRNDLGRVADHGSVGAAATPDVEAHPGLWHLVTRVHGRLREGVADSDLLRATFPPGSVTGAPKIQSLKVISALEGTAREVYTGAIGIVSPAVGLELGVAIRTVEVRDGVAWLGCGGGIVADSVPEDELREAFAKARPIAAALGTSIGTPAPAGVPLRGLPRLERRPDPERGLLETMLVRGGRIVALDEHLARLAAGLRDLFEADLPPELRLRLQAEAIGHEAARLRIVVGGGGDEELAIRPVDSGPAPAALTPVVVPGGLGRYKWADRDPLAPFDGPGRAAVICDADGAVLEASSANVWALIGDRLVTPPADGRILPGVTRSRVLDLGSAGSVRIAEEPFTLADLEAADGIVVTSAIRVVAAAALGTGRPAARAGRLAEELRQALYAVISSGSGSTPSLRLSPSALK